MAKPKPGQLHFFDAFEPKSVSRKSQTEAPTPKSPSSNAQTPKKPIRVSPSWKERRS